MYSLPPMDDEERVLMHQLVCHFVVKLNEERAGAADLIRQLELANRRIALLEAANFGLY